MAIGSASKVSRWRRCRHACWYSDVLEVVPVFKSLAPSKGNILHRCLEEHYSGRDWTKPIVDLKLDLTKVFDEEREEWANLPNELYRVMKSYINTYRAIDSSYTVIAVEHKFEYKLNEHHSYTGFIDLVWMDSEKNVWIVDHKTVKTLPDERDLYMDLQLVMYYDAVMNDTELMKAINAVGGKVAGFMFNHVRVKPPKEPQLLKSGGLSKAQIDSDVQTYFDTVRKHGLDPSDYEDMIEKLKGNTFFKRMKLPVSKKTLEIIKGEIITTLDEYEQYVRLAKTYDGIDPSVKTMFVRNTLKQRCSWDCPYQKLCYAELAGRKIDDILADEYEAKTKVEEDESDGE